MNNSVTTVYTRLWKRKTFALVVLIFGFISVSFAEDKKIDVNALLADTQKQSQSSDKLAMVWWIPEEFWRASFEQDKNISAAQTDAFIKMLRPYTVIVAIDADIGVMGGVTYKPQAAIQKGIQIVDAQGTHYQPLNEEKIDADTKNFLAMMKPVFSNMLGTMGQNMNFFLFLATNEKGQNIIDAKNEGSFSVLLDKTEFKWRLPLGSLLPPKTCPVDNEKLNGAWKFCPWHGVELK